MVQITLNIRDNYEVIGNKEWWWSDS